jgi:threonine-phosphate decarboxylase
MIDRIRNSFARAEECYHGGKFREAAESLGCYPLDFSANINPLGAPPLEEVVLKELEHVGHYPDNRYSEFREAAARFVCVSPDNIVPGNGSSELIRLFTEMTLEENDSVLIPQPTFGEYENQSRLAGAKICYTQLNRGLPIVDDRELKEAKALFLCNPNNPTGFLLHQKKIAGLAERCESSETFFVVDEAFIDLSDPKQSVAQLAIDLDYLFVMRSLTKSFGVPGLRLGFGIANQPLANIMNKTRIPWSISSLAAAAAPYLLSQTEYLERARELIRDALAWMMDTLQKIGLRPLPSKANFILIDVEPSGFDSDELARRTAAQGVLVRDCLSFGLGKRFIRVAVRKRKENLKLIAALEGALRCKG